MRSISDTSKCRLNGVIAAGKRAVLVENLDSFKKYHGDTIQIVGKLPYKLKNTDSMVLFDLNNNPIQVFVYSELAPWPANTNDAHSMILNETNNNNHYTYANHWKQGCILGDPGILSINCRTVGIEKINTNNHIFDIFGPLFGNMPIFIIYSAMMRYETFVIILLVICCRQCLLLIFLV